MLDGGNGRAMVQGASVPAHGGQRHAAAAHLRLWGRKNQQRRRQSVAGGLTRPRRRPPRLPCAGAEAAPAAAPLRLLAAGLAAAALSVGGPAEAGVVLVQPEVKNFVKDQPAAAKPAAGKKAAPKKEESSSSGGLAFETFRPLVLPLSVIAVVGAGAAAAKADPKFAELLDAEWSAKDSNAVGAGYETAPGLKDTPFYGGSNTNGAVAKVRRRGDGPGSGTAPAGVVPRPQGRPRRALVARLLLFASALPWCWLPAPPHTPVAPLLLPPVQKGTAKKAAPKKAGTAKKSALGSIFGSRD